MISKIGVIDTDLNYITITISTHETGLIQHNMVSILTPFNKRIKNQQFS